MLKNYDESLNAIEDRLNYYNKVRNEEDNYSGSTCGAYATQAKALFELERYEEALKIIGKREVLAEENNISNDRDFDKEFSELKTNCYKLLISNFSNVSFDNKKQVFVSDKLYPSENFIILKKQELPKTITFPFGHPHNNNLYTSHPLRNGYYIPLKKLQQELFKDRISEFCYLMQCLGATKIEINTSKKNSIKNDSNSSLKIDAKIDYKVSKISGQYQNENHQENEKIELLGIKKHQTFKPIDAPYVPKDLIWYDSETSWQRLVNQRLNGNIETYTENIVSTFSEVVSNNEIRKINAELKFLLPKIGLNYNKESEINSNAQEVLEWSVYMEFQDKNLLLEKEININSSNQAEIEKYKEDVAFMLEDDGYIDDVERKMLNRKIEKYGLTKEEADEIENHLLGNKYTENELLYIDELKEIIEDGEITEFELKMLSRYAQKFDINEETKERIDSIYIR